VDQERGLIGQIKTTGRSLLLDSDVLDIRTRCCEGGERVLLAKEVWDSRNTFTDTAARARLRGLLKRFPSAIEAIDLAVWPDSAYNIADDYLHIVASRTDLHLPRTAGEGDLIDELRTADRVVARSDRIT
jgi:hypothetical protein